MGSTYIQLPVEEDQVDRLFTPSLATGSDLRGAGAVCNGAALEMEIAGGGVTILWQ